MIVDSGTWLVAGIAVPIVSSGVSKSPYTFVPPLRKPCECVRSKDWENDALIVYLSSM